MARAPKVLSLLLGSPISVPEGLLSRFPELAAIRLRRGGLPPRLGGWCLGRSCVSGITFGRWVWLGPTTPITAELLLHELRHVHQFQALRAFPLRYMVESLRRGYEMNRYEVDARCYVAARLVGESAGSLVIGTSTGRGPQERQTE